MASAWDSALVLSYAEGMKSKDPSTQNGAVLVDDDLDVYGIGHNHFPKGVADTFWDNGNKEDKYARVVHAEVAAILDAAKRGFATSHMNLVCGWAACSNCAKHIADSGVSRLVRHTFIQNVGTTNNYWYDDCLLGDEIMREAGVEIIEVEPVFVGLRRNGVVWTPGADE